MRTSRIFWSLLLLFLSLTAAARAQGDRDSLAAATTDPLTVQTAGGNSLAAVEQVWDAANTAYINSDYHRAIDAYRQLILRGYASDKLYYNLANAYFKVGRYGKAILYYNRALRLAPGDADIRYNLDVANTFTKDKIAVVPEFFLKGWVRSVRMSLGCTAWSVVSLAALALLKIRSVVWWQAALMVAGGFLLLLIPVIGMPLVVPVTAGLLSWRGGISLERALAAVLVQFGILLFCLLAVVMPWYWLFD